MHKLNGGSTFNLKNSENLAGKDVYSVSIFPERSMIIDGKDITKENVNEFIKNNSDLLDNEKISIDTWYDDMSGKTYIDAVVTTNKDEALKLGKKYNQKAIFGLKNFDEIPTGGTGESIDGLGKIEDRIKSLKTKKLSVKVNKK